MRNFFIFFSLFISLCSYGQISLTTTFDFSDVEQYGVVPAEDHGSSVNITTLRLVSDDVTISFARTDAAPAGAQIQTIKEGNSTRYQLHINRGCTMTFSVPEGSTINFVEFDGLRGDLGLRDEKVGKLSYNGMVWEDNGNSYQSIDFWNTYVKSELNSIKVNYTLASAVLDPVVSVASGSLVSTLKDLTLTFDKTMIQQSAAEGIQLLGPDTTSVTGTGKLPYAITAVVDAEQKNVVRLTVVDDSLPDGAYELTIPEKSFKEDAGVRSFENKTLVYTYNVQAPFDVLRPTQITPSTDEVVASLKSPIVLSFKPNFIQNVENVKVPLLRNGKEVSVVTLNRTGNNDQVSATFDIPEIADTAVYSITIPAQTILSQDQKHYNPEFSIVYKVGADPDDVVVPGDDDVKSDSALYRKAVALLDLKGVGYPAANSVARIALANTVGHETLASDETFEAAIAQYLSEKEIELPAAGNWYNVFAQNAKGEKAYLAVENGNVVLTSDSAKAYAFQAEAGADASSIKLRTLSSLYLHNLVGSTSYEGASAQGLTTDASAAVAQLTLARFAAEGVDNTETLGLVSLNGSLGKNAGADVKANAAVAFGEATKVATDPAATALAYTDALTNAFGFAAVEAPAVQYDTLAVAVSVADEVVRDITVAELVKFEADSVSVANASLIKLYNTDRQREYAATVVADTLANGIGLSAANLPDGNYEVTFEAGALQIVKDGKIFNNATLKTNFAVDSSEDYIYDFNPSMILPFGPTDYLTDEELLDFKIYSAEPIYACADTVIVIHKFYDRYKRAVASGHFERFEDADGSMGLKLVIDEPLSRSLTADYYTIRVPAGTYGDINFKNYLDGVEPHKYNCHVNAYVGFSVNVDNNNPTSSIDGIDINGSSKLKIYDLSGRRLERIAKPGLYIINGKKVVVKQSDIQ